MPLPLDYESRGTPPPRAQTEVRAPALAWLAPTIVGAIAVAIYVASAIRFDSGTPGFAGAVVSRVLLDNLFAVVAFYLFAAMMNVGVGHLGLSLPRAAAIVGLLGACATAMPVVGAGIGCFVAAVLFCWMLKIELGESVVIALLLVGVKLGLWFALGFTGWIDKLR